MADKDTLERPLTGLQSYISELRNLAIEPLCSESWEDKCRYALNGGPGKELRRLISLDLQRKYGAFFTGSELADLLLGEVNFVTKRGVYYDPCCGMGDLLLAVARKLPLGNSFENTIETWGEILSGTDLHQEFINGAKARLVILACKRHNRNSSGNLNWKNIFPKIRVADGLEEKKSYQQASYILINPPFGYVIAPPHYKWAKGRISESASFIFSSLERSKPGTEILAILPDVLRSGSNYRHWRKSISELGEIRYIKAYGLFDKNADIDVFLLKLIRKRKRNIKEENNWPEFKKENEISVSDFFVVSVGYVVPHRDPEKGNDSVYIHPRCIPVWSIMSEFTENRRHQRKPIIPPFVVIKRTSRPGDIYRATATVISGKAPVAVENHLIVCKPKDKKLATCLKLMHQLKSDHINQYLNNRIRCRHLTVSSVEMIPFNLSRSINAK